MTCHHRAGDPNCSSNRSYVESYQYEKEKIKKEQAELLARTPNPSIFEVIKVEEVGPHLVMMVKYSSCTKCSFDSKKVLVFQNCNLKNAILWRHIDPHFSDKSPGKDNKVAPSPVARFPADDFGWKTALEFAGKILQSVNVG